MGRKLIGKFVVDKLSGKVGIVCEKKKKGQYVVRVWAPEVANWLAIPMPRKQFTVGKKKKQKPIGFKP